MVRLKVFSGHIDLRLLFYKKISIYSQDINSIEPYTLFPFVEEGILIKLKEKKKFGTFIMSTDRVIFWYFGDKEKLAIEMNAILKLNENL